MIATLKWQGFLGGCSVMKIHGFGTGDLPTKVTPAKPWW